MFEKIKAKLEEALLEIEIGIEEALERGEQDTADLIGAHLTATKALIAQLEAKEAA